MFGSAWFGFPGQTKPFFKLCPRDRPLTASPCNQFPERRITSKFQLFSIKALDTNNEGNRLPVSSNHDSFALRFINTSIKVRLFYPITFI